MWSTAQTVKISTDMMFMLGLNETIGQLAVANSVCWHCEELKRGDKHVLRRALHLEVDGQRKKGRPKRNGKSRLRKKVWRLV